VWELSDFWIDQAKAAGAKMAELGLLEAEPDCDDLIRTEYQPGREPFSHARGPHDVTSG
jgi:hypothetical protein